MAAFPDKDPNDDIDVSFDWTDELAEGETISTATVTVDPSGELTIQPAVINGGLVSTRIAAGVLGKTYWLTFQITTSLGNTLNRKASQAVADL